MDYEKYETKEIELGLKEVEAYIAPISPRDLRENHVDKIHNSFNKVKSVEGIIAVNMISEKKKLEVIDGNHRMTAIKKWLEGHVDDKIKATFHIYHDLTENQKKAVFVKLQDSIKMSKTDMVKTQCYDSFIYKAFIPADKRLPFPCRVTLNETDKRNSIKFFRLVEPYQYRNMKTVGTISLRNFATTINKLNKDDFERMSQYMTDFIAVFGEPHSEMNRLYSGMVFHLGYQKAYWQGVNCLGRERFVSVMKRNYAMIRGAIESELVSRSGYHAQAEFVYSIIRKSLNKWERKSMSNILELPEDE